MKTIWIGAFVAMAMFVAGVSAEPATSQPTSGPVTKATLPTTTTSAPAIDARVVEIVNKLAAYSKTIKNMSVEVQSSTKVTGPMGEQSATIDMVIVAERPNRIAVKGRYQLGDFIIVSDGQTLSIYVQVVGKYVQMPAPKAFDELTSMPHRCCRKISARWRCCRCSARRSEKTCCRV
jgi:hypothetical protein